MGSGVHPCGSFGFPQIAACERYGAVAASLAGLLRTPTCALHVHVGMPDAESAIRVCNTLRADVPLLLALSANSPFWHGRDSGLASAHTAIVRSYPRAGLPRAFHDYEDFCATADRLTATAEVEDYTHIWWDIRPHPRLGTIEVRVMDAQSSLDLTAGLVALVHGLAAHALEEERPPVPSDEMLAECSFRAARYGAAATLADREGRLRPVQELARSALARAWPLARERGCEEALALVETLLAAGNGAQRQREAYETDGMPGVVAYLLDSTRSPI
jgi:glutamate---cysteine ligase / carboxylate-amine ligase